MLLAVAVQAIIRPAATEKHDACSISAADFVAQDIADAVLIDVRTAAEYNSGHLAGAILMDVRNRGFQDHLRQLDKGASYFVYCKTGIRSALAARHMRQAGFARVCNVEGGILRLSKLGAELVR
jgi:rhodanese-related sulfurtransferase